MAARARDCRSAGLARREVLHRGAAADAAIQSFTSIFEPILMIGVGAMVGTIVISMYLPMFKMLTLIK